MDKSEREQQVAQQIRGGARTSAPVTTNVVLRPLGNPLPIGLFAIGAGAFIVAVEQLGWLATRELAGVGFLLFAFAVPLAVGAAIFAMLSRDTVAATALGIGAGTLAGFGLTYIGGTPLSIGAGVAATHVFAWFLFASAAVMIVTAITTMTARPVFSAAVMMFGLWSVATAIYQLTATHGWETIAGIVGLIVAAACLAAGSLREASEEMNHSVGEVHEMPTLLQDSYGSNGFSAEVPGLEREPGVRAKL